MLMPQSFAFFFRSFDINWEEFLNILEIGQNGNFLELSSSDPAQFSIDISLNEY